MVVPKFSDAETIVKNGRLFIVMSCIGKDYSAWGINGLIY